MAIVDRVCSASRNLESINQMNGDGGGDDDKVHQSKSPKQKQPSCLNRRRRRMCFWRFVFWIFGGEDIFFFFYNLIVHNCVELFPSSACPFGARVDEAAGVRTKQEFWLLFAFVYARRTNYLFVWLKLFFVCAFLAKTCPFFLFHKAQICLDLFIIPMCAWTGSKCAHN